MVKFTVITLFVSFLLGSNAYESNVDDLISLKKFKRQLNGKNNNPDHPLWGSSLIPFERLGNKNSYADGKQEPRKDLLWARTISNTMGAQDQNVPMNRNRLSSLFTIWGQIVDHQLTLFQDEDEEKVVKMPMKVPQGDSPFDKLKTGKQEIPFKRSKPFFDKNGVRNPINTLTAWFDGSVIYGVNEQVLKPIRQFSNGKMKVSQHNLLPRGQNNFFLSGDKRVNENIALTSLHTLLVREHNRVCDKILSRNSSLSDEEIFQAAKNYMAGLISKITFDDFLYHLLGENAWNKYIGKYKGYNSKISPNLLNQFSTGAFRIGHPLLSEKFPQIDENNKITINFSLKDIFHRNDFYVNSSQIDTTIRGLALSLAKQKTCTIVDSVRNFLFTDPKFKDVKVDLYSLNLQRARDHGILSYNKCREELGLRPYKFFSEISYNYQDVVKMSKSYQTLNDLELFPGVLCETANYKGVLGQVGAAIVGSTFQKIRDGDSFWYEKIFPKSIIEELKQTTLSDVIMRNTNIKNLPKNAFVVPKK